MAEEIKQRLDVTADEAGLVMFIRNTHAFSKIVVHKYNGKIERFELNETHTSKDVNKRFGIVVEKSPEVLELIKPLDKMLSDDIL